MSPSLNLVGISCGYDIESPTTSVVKDDRQVTSRLRLAYNSIPASPHPDAQTGSIEADILDLVSIDVMPRDMRFILIIPD